jgi:hypothetical protein
MVEEISDTSEIRRRLKELKEATESGYYAPVREFTLYTDANGPDAIELGLDLPDTSDTSVNMTFKLSVPKYWEKRRNLIQYMNILDLTIDTIGEIENRSLPVKRDSGEWVIDQDRLKNGDYIKGEEYIRLSDI